MENDNFVRFQSISAARDKKPRVKELCEKSGADDEPLHQALLARFPKLLYGPEDRRARLVTSTLNARRMLADQWVGRCPWFYLPQHKALPAGRSIRRSRRLEEKQLPQDPDDEHHEDEPDPIPVYWQPEWLSQFGFMLDATTFSNADGPLSRKAKHVYYSTEDVWGPREETPDPSISQTVSIMVYCVIHKHLGIVVGPDIMYTGTKLQFTKGDKEAQFQEKGVRTWYANRQ